MEILGTGLASSLGYDRNRVSLTFSPTAHSETPIFRNKYMNEVIHFR